MKQEITIKRYLTESKEVIEAIRTEKSMALISPCGTGKTYTIINTLKADKQKFIFIVPNISVKLQLAEEYELATNDKSTSLTKLLKHGATEIVCCYEALKKVKVTSLLEGFALVWDEYHSMLLDIHYRNNTQILELLKVFERTLFLTATPHKLIKVYDKIIEVKSESKRNVTVTIVKPEKERLSKGQYYDFLKLVEEKIKAPTLLVFSNGIEMMKKIVGDEVIFSETRDNERLKSIIGGTLPPGLTVSTNLFNAGLSLRNKEEVCLIIDFKAYDVNRSSYNQMIERFRESSHVRVFVINRNYQQLKASNETIEEWGEELIHRMETGEVSLPEVFAFNSPFAQAICLDNVSKRFYLDETGLKIAEQRINGYKSSSEVILKELCEEKEWSFKGIYTVKDIGTVLEENPEEEKKQKPKTVLREIFLTDNEVNQFAKTYFMSRLTEDRHSYNKEWMEQQFQQEQLTLISAMRDRATRNAVQNLTKKMIGIQDINSTLNSYFNVSSKFDPLNIPSEKIEEVREEILGYGIDNHIYGKTRFILGKHFRAFQPNRTITPDRQVKEILEFLGIKVSRKKGETTITFSEK